MKYEGWKVGERIRKLRQDRNMTSEEFCSRLGVSISHVRQIEQGERKMSINLMYRLMDVLEVDANTLLAIPECSSRNVSIDDELFELPKEQKRYFESIFLQMIQKFPA